MATRAEQLGKSLEKLKYPDVSKCNLVDLPVGEFSIILSWISKRFSFFLKTESIVQPVDDENDAMSIPSLKLELNSLLKELGSIYGDNFNIDSHEERQKILQTLIGDLYGSQIKYLKTSDDEFTLEMNPKKDIENIANSLSLPNQFSDVNDFFQKVCQKIQQNITRFDVDGSFFLRDKNADKGFTEQEWNELKSVNGTLNQEYSIRREMMLRRLDTTIASFTWKANEKENKTSEIKTLYHKIRKPLTATPRVSLSHALAARLSDFDKLLNERISTTHESCLIVAPSLQKLANQGAQQRTELHKFLIGNVPDRGGRPDEQQAPRREQRFGGQQHRGQRDHFRQGGGNRGGYGNNRGGFGGNRGGSNFHQPRNIPDDNGQRIQGAGWQGNDGSVRYQNNNQRGGGPHRRNRDQYEHNDNSGGNWNRRGGGQYESRGRRGRYN